jgi:hypothetical protein
MPTTLTLRHTDRLDYLRRVGRDIEDVFNAYLAPYAQGLVVDPHGRIVPDISPRLRRAQAKVTAATAAFERAAAQDLAALEGGKQ